MSRGQTPSEPSSTLHEAGNAEHVPAEGAAHLALRADLLTEKELHASASPLSAWGRGGVSAHIHDVAGFPRDPAGGAGSCMLNVKRQSASGLLITDPKIVLMWWSTYFWDRHLADRHYYRDALTAVTADSAFWNRLSEYDITGGSFAGTIDLTRFGGPVSASEAQIQDAMTYRWQVSQIVPDPNTIYVVMLPNGVTSAYDAANSFIGHHGLYEHNGGNVIYAVVEYSTNRTQVMSVITHEIYEAATNPDGSTGYWDPPHGGETEIGDPCNLQTFLMDGYPIQRVWSQKSCGCA